MPELNPSSSYGSLGLALWAQTNTDLPGHIRPLEYFGGQAVGFSETPVDNLAAMNAALDWCAGTGGMVILGAGVYGVDGSVPLQSYSNIRGMGMFQTKILQLASSPTDVLTSSAGVGESIAFCDIQDICIDGGWIAPGNWGVDRTTHTAAGIRLIGDSGGPDDPVALARQGLETMADPFHYISRVFVMGVPGSGIVTGGRGETHIRNNYVWRCSLYGIEGNAPDCWLSGNTVNVTGDSGVKLTGGNQRLSDEKYWFCGARTDQEGVGAGLEIVGPGVANITGSTVTTQDTWGPGFVLDGDAPIFQACGIDEAGGGRLEQQGLGFAGTRTDPRCFIRTGGPVSNALVQATVRGGDRNGPTNRPALVHFDSFGGGGNRIDVMSEGGVFADPLIAVSSGYTSSEQVNHVMLNGAGVYGAISPADLASAAHWINTTGVGGSVTLTDGTIALRFGSEWRVFSGAAVVPA